MPTQLKYDTKLTKNKHLALILNPDQDLNGTDLTAEEQAYVTAQIRHKNKLIVLNRLSHRVYIIITTPKPALPAYHEEVRKAGFELQKLLKTDKAEEIFLSDLTHTSASYYLAEGLFLSNYAFDKYKTDKRGASLLTSIIITDSTIAEAEVTELNNVLQGVYLARDLVNEPHNYQSAEQLAETIVAVGENAGFKTETLDLLKIQALKMGGILAVNQGSIDPPTFSILEWKPENAGNRQPYVLVGKGVVYDTG
nr:peptidase M17 [Segetibacter sp.]